MELLVIIPTCSINISFLPLWIKAEKMNLSLEGKYAIICGSTQGIGLAIAEELALLGANCTLIARNEEALKAVVHNLDIALRQQHNYLVCRLLLEKKNTR